MRDTKLISRFIQITSNLTEFTIQRIPVMTESVVARFKQEQALQEQAAQRGLYGVALVASHEIITARMERGAERLLQLIEEGRLEEAKALFSTEEWW